MVNLITTIIAIALMASVAIFGLDYGTRSFDQMRARTNALQIVSDARSIATGWKNYSRANNGNYLLTDYDWSDGTAADLIGTYLNKLPTPPNNVALATQNYYLPVKLTNFATSGGVSASSDVNAIGLRITNPDVCKAIAKLNEGGAPALKASTGASDDGLSGDLSATGLRQPYDCIYKDTDGSGTLTAGDAMLFVYPLFNQDSSYSPGSIYIASARYGSPVVQQWCDTDVYVKVRCQGQSSCILDAANSGCKCNGSCNDPAPGQFKYLEVTYGCGSSSGRNISIYEYGGTGTLSCP